MLETLLVLALVLGAIALYALARRYGVQPMGAGVLAVTGTCITIVVSLIALSTAAARQPRALSADTAAPAAAAAPSPAAIAIASVRGLASAPVTQGSIDGIRVSPAGAGQYDAGRHKLQVHRGAQITLEGWGDDASAKLPGAGVAVLIDGQIIATGLYGFDRDDVAKYFGIPAVRFSGYRIQLAADSIAPGKHLMNVAVIAADRKHYEPLSARVNVIVVP